MRETQAALQGLHNKPIALDAQLRLYPPQALSYSFSVPSPSTHDSTSMAYPRHAAPPVARSKNIVPFPSSGDFDEPSPLAHVEAMLPPRPRSAEPGDGVKAFTAATKVLEERHRLRLDVPQDESFERQRSLSFDAQERHRAAQEAAAAYAHLDDPYEYHQQPSYSDEFGGGHEYGWAFIRTGQDYAQTQQGQVPYVLSPQAHSRRAGPGVRDLETHSSPRHQTSHPTRAYPARPPAVHPPTSHPSPAPPHPEHNQVNLAKIEKGSDTRTTVMIKNIPNKMSDRDLMTYIAKVVPNRIDFFYLRMDFQNGEHLLGRWILFFSLHDTDHVQVATWAMPL